MKFKLDECLDIRLAALFADFAVAHSSHGGHLHQDEFERAGVIPSGKGGQKIQAVSETKNVIVISNVL